MILITGASGFIGQHAHRLWAGKTKKEPVRLFLLESEVERIDNTAGFDIVTGDLSDKEAVKKAAAGVDTIIHLASKHIDFDGTGFQKINIDGTANLCEAAVSAGCKKFIYLSSVGVYGHHKYRDADEETPSDPDTPYSRSKAEAEGMVLAHHKAGDFQGIVLRHRFVYGEGDAHVLPRIIKATTKYPFMLNWGKQKVSVIFVKELAEILKRFAEENIPRETNPIYHVTDGAPIRYRDLVGTICNSYSIKYPKLGIPFLLLYIPVRIYEKIFSIDPETAHSSLSSIRLKLVGLDNYFSNAKVMKLFPDLKLTPFKEAFSQTAEYYEQFMPVPDSKQQNER